MNFLTQSRASYKHKKRLTFIRRIFCISLLNYLIIVMMMKDNFILVVHLDKRPAY